MRRLSAAATYLYQDGARYWYATQATVTKLAEERAEQLKRDPDKVAHELEQQLREDLRKTGEFSRVHILPHSGGDVPDDYDARLVVLGPDHAYSRDKDSAAEVAAKEILESRGTAPRLFRNTLVFLAADKVRYQDLDEGFIFGFSARATDVASGSRMALAAPFGDRASCGAGKQEAPKR